MYRGDLNELAVFAAVAQERSFTRAATRLNQSQSALSQTVRRLESRLGMRLLTRTTRNVAPTPEGERLLETLRPALADIDARIAELGELREKPAGTVRLTLGRHAAETLIWPAVAELVSTYPDIVVELSIDQSLTDIVEGKYDAGVRLGEQVAKDMIAVKIGPDLRMAVVASPAYIAEHGTPTTPHHLLSHRCINIRFPKSGALYAWEFEKDGRELNVRVTGPFVVSDTTLACRAALDGIGVSMVMEDMVATAIADGRLIRMLDDWCQPFLGYHLYYPDRRHPSPSFAALTKLLVDRERSSFTTDLKAHHRR
jgi:DNA-binding transcriptional LysR family regulator